MLHLTSIGKLRLLRVNERMDRKKSFIIVFANKLACLSVQSVRGDAWLVRDTHSRNILARSTANVRVSLVRVLRVNFNE